MFSLLAGWVRCCWRCSSVQCSTRGRPAPGPPPDARIPTTDVTTSHTPARARILLVLRCLVNNPGHLKNLSHRRPILTPLPDQNLAAKTITSGTEGGSALDAD